MQREVGVARVLVPEHDDVALLPQHVVDRRRSGMEPVVGLV